MNNWYDVIDSATNISQGEILFNVPLFVPNYPKDDLTPAEFQNIKDQTIKTEILRTDVIILTQACDLEVRKGNTTPKVETVLVASLDDVRAIGAGRDNLRNIAKLNKTEYFLLEPSLEAVLMGYKIVRFDYLNTIPWKILNKYSQTQDLRLRLKSPYLEQLSQHFGNNFGRVALPGNRDDSINWYFDKQKEYEDTRKQDNSMKVWKDLSVEEMISYIKVEKDIQND